MKYRLKFSKLGSIKYIGHLDLIRLFQRAIKRAQIEICYSQGFNPHQLSTIVYPLSVGFESIGEYIEVEVREKKDPRDIEKSLNSQLPMGLKVINCIQCQEGEKNATASISAAKYEAKLNLSNTIQKDYIEKALNDFIQQESIIVNKTIKKKIKQIDIKNGIKELSLTKTNGCYVLFMFLTAGSSDNIKPELVIESFYSYLNIPFDKNKINFKRLDIYKNKDGQYMPLI